MGATRKSSIIDDIAKRDALSAALPQLKAMRKGVRLRAVIDAVVREWLEGAASDRPREAWWATQLISALEQIQQAELNNARGESDVYSPDSAPAES